MLDLLRAFLGDPPEPTEEEKHELVMDGKPERMTGLTFRISTNLETEYTFLRISPSWDNHSVVIVSRDLADNGDTITSPGEEEELSVRAELVGKRRTTLMIAHLIPLGGNEYRVETCPIGRFSLDVTERIYDGEVPPLTEVLAEFGIELVDSEGDMLASEEGVEA